MHFHTDRSRISGSYLHLAILYVYASKGYPVKVILCRIDRRQLHGYPVWGYRWAAECADPSSAKTGSKQTVPVCQAQVYAS